MGREEFSKEVAFKLKEKELALCLFQNKSVPGRRNSKVKNNISKIFCDLLCANKHFV
jgi:hypothetical protein